MNEKNKNLVLRVVSALVLLPIVLFLLAKGGAWSAALFAAAAAACTSEYYTITLKQLLAGRLGRHPAVGRHPLAAAA